MKKMAGQKTITSTFIPPPPVPPVPPVPDIILSGDGAPSPNGDYFVAGLHDGANYYTSPTTAFVVFKFAPGGIWVIANTFPDTPGGYWYSNGTALLDVYNAQAPYSGEVMVS